jgi:hypothetical protein
MGKKTRAKAAPAGENPRRPCPCGSGKRYKACHGAGDDVIVIRPFEGLAAECDLVAMREFLPSATAPLPLREPVDAPVTLADLAKALRWAQAAEPGTALPVVGPGVASELVRLQDVLDPAAALDVTVHTDFGWWIPPAEDGSEPSPDVTAALERANKVIMPTEPVPAPGVRSAYWVDTGSKAHLRWVRPEPEEALLAALARLQARGELALAEDARYAGSFRAHGLLVPVWDLDRELHAKEWTEPLSTFAERLETALGDDAPLTDSERRARDALAGKQITLR